jgi:hypothetical protein
MSDERPDGWRSIPNKVTFFFLATTFSLVPMSIGGYLLGDKAAVA